MNKRPLADTISRDSNLELARIVVMAMIIIWHFIVHGLWGMDRFTTVDASGPLHFDQYVQWLISCFCVVGVNVFVLISGYFRIKLRWSSIIKYYFMCVFYSIIILLVNMHTKGYGLSDFADIFFLSNTPIWFFPSYFILMLVSPFLNAALDKLDISQLRVATLLILVLMCASGWYFQNGNDNGYNAYQLISIYLIGGYVSKEPLFMSIGKKRPLILYLFFCCLNFLAMIVLYYAFRKDVLAMLNYNCIFVVLSSISLFLFFKGLDVRSAAINKVSSTVVAALFIQSTVSQPLYWYIHHLYMSDGFTFRLLLLLILSFLAIFSLAYVIETLRKRIMNPLGDKVADALDRHFLMPFSATPGSSNSNK